MAGHKFHPHQWERLLSAERHQLLDPEAFLDRVGVGAGMHVADLGAGPGFFTLPLARRVGTRGHVWALDVAPQMIDVLRERGLPPNAEALLSEESRLPLSDASADLELLAFVLHEVHEPAVFLAEARRVLRPGGRLVVLEWVPQEEEQGPPLHERLTPDRSAALLADGGFEVTERGDANRSHYYLIARPRPAA